MSIRERNIDCSCGQPVDLVAAVGAHCPRCGRTVARSASDRDARRTFLAGPVLLTTRAS